ncbi:MAG: ATP-binding cassette domain-containing protein [Oscillospiraceae bacterium]
MAVFLLLFNILTLAVQVTGAEEEWGLRISRSAYDGNGFSAEDTAYISSLEGVKQTRLVYEPRDYILLPTRWRSLRSRCAYGRAASTRRRSPFPSMRLPSAARGSSVGGICCVSAGSKKYYNADGFAAETAPEDVTTLTVTALADTEPFGSSVDIYVSDELYADIIATEPLTGIEIALTEPAMNAQVEEALLARFTGAEYQLTNRQSGADFLREMSSGVYLLLAYIFSALFLFILLIIYVRLCDYIEGSRPLIRSLHRLGASKRTLYLSYIRQAGVSAPAIAVAAPFLISLPLTALLCAWQNAPLHIDGVMLAAYEAAGGSAAAKLSASDTPDAKTGAASPINKGDVLMDAITVKNLSKVFRQGDESIRAVDNISFTVAPGELVAIVGQSGSGKTTLFEPDRRHRASQLRQCGGGRHERLHRRR